MEYAARKLLPARRMQLQLAQIAMMVVQAAGAKGQLSLRDFLFDPTDEPDEDDEDAAREFFGFQPINTKA